MREDVVGGVFVFSYKIYKKKTEIPKQYPGAAL